MDRGALGLVVALLVLLATCHLLARRVDAERERVLQIPLKELDGASDRRRRELTRRLYAAYLPKTSALEWMSLGNTNVAADFVLLKTLAYTSAEVGRGGDKMDWLQKHKR